MAWPRIDPEALDAATAAGPGQVARSRFWQDFQARKLLGNAVLRSVAGSMVIPGYGLTTGRVYIGSHALVFMQDDDTAAQPDSDGPAQLVHVAAFTWLGTATLDIARLGATGLVTFSDGTIIRIPKPEARLIQRLSEFSRTSSPASSRPIEPAADRDSRS